MSVKGMRIGDPWTVCLLYSSLFSYVGPSDQTMNVDWSWRVGMGSGLGLDGGSGGKFGLTYSANLVPG